MRSVVRVHCGPPFKIRDREVSFFIFVFFLRFGNNYCMKNCVTFEDTVDDSCSSFKLALEAYCAEKELKIINRFLGH